MRSHICWGSLAIMRLAFMFSGRARTLREVATLRMRDRLEAAPPGTREVPPRAVLAGWGVVVMVGEPSPRDHLVSAMTVCGEGSDAVERIEDAMWVGDGLLLLRLGMADRIRRRPFERWVVFDCAREEVEYVAHDLPPIGGVLRAIGSNDASHVWLQHLRVALEGDRAQQVAGPEGEVLVLHRVPLARLMSTSCAPPQLFGPLTRVCALTASMLTAGERTRLAPLEIALVEDVMVGLDGSPNLVTLLGSYLPDSDRLEAIELYELAPDGEGAWTAARLFEGLEDVQSAMLY